MKILLGIDPGSRITGYGVIGVEGQKVTHLASGAIQTSQPCLADRLNEIYEGISLVIKRHKPDTAAIEQVFMYKNAESALKLGHARGAAMVAMSHAHLEIGEYSARQVKQSVVGYGAADKSQVQHMVKLLLNIQGPPLQADEADALAVALCHMHTSESLIHLKSGEKVVRGRIR